MIERLRRHGRLIAGALAVVLVASVAFVVRSAHAHSGQVAAMRVAVHAIAPVLAPAPQRRAAALARRIRVAATAGRRSSHRARPSAAHAGLATPPPTRRGLALVLRQATGLSPAQVSTHAVCGRSTAGHASCAAQTLVLRSTGAPVHPRVTSYRAQTRRTRPALAGRAAPRLVASAAPPQPDTPAYLTQAYDLSYLSQTAGSSDTVAIVDAYDDPTAEADLATYRSTYGLPACTSASGCFEKVNQTGAPSSMPPANADWDQEISLDLDAVSAVCPLCHILLVEANSNAFSDLEAAMQTAASLGANQISASWSGTSSTVPSVFHTFSGVATVAATGDYGYVGAGQDNYPAALPGVTAAGGTSLSPATGSSARGFGEAAWSWDGASGGGSGCDVQFSRPAYQPAAGCAGRAYADLSADADPSTGLSVYENGTWSVVGGTSLATPLIAAYYAVTGVSATTPRWAYSDSGLLNDITSGSTGYCDASIAYICEAGAGYDGPTGVGSISGSVVTGAPGIGGPSVSSGSADTYTQSVTAHGATITGGIYRNGLDTSWWIEYGATTAYGSQTAAVDIGAGSAPAMVTGYLSQLTPGTTYHYRLVARNSVGTTYGYDYTFTTPANAASPTSAFTLSPSSLAPGAYVTFNGSASTPAAGSSITDYRWNFGDGTTTHTAIPTVAHAYATRGSYTVTLTVTSNGQTDTSAQTITVDNPPTASVNPSSAAVAPGAKVGFDASRSVAGSGGSIIDYSWDFGDGSTADTGATAGATHAFTTPGTYTVTLTATDDLNVTTTATAQVTVASFAATPSVASPGATVTFNTLSATSPGGTISDHIWDFGDGSQIDTGVAASAPHVYAARGTYTVTLTLENTLGQTYTSSETVTVDTPPVAVLTPSSAAVAPGSTVGLNASTSSAVVGGSIRDYRWDFGDGSPVQDTGATATNGHVYTMPGVYAVTLTVTDDLGVSATTTRMVTVDQPSAAFTVSAANATPNSPVSFDANGTSDQVAQITDYRWNFGDGTGSVDGGTSAAATHSFAAAGTYTVTLSVTDQLGFTATTSLPVVISPASIQSTPPPVTTPPAPVTTPAPAPVTPPAPTPPSPGSSKTSLSARLTGAGRQRLARALAHGVRLALALNQNAKASFQITIPLAQTKHHPTAATHRTRDAKTSVVLLRSARTLGAGGHAITLKLPRAAANRLAATGSLVVTVRVTVTGGAGAAVTRTVKVALTR